MFLEASVIAIGVLISFYLKGLNFLAFNFVYPDFLIIFLIYFALRRGEFSGIWIGFFAGLLEDSAILFFSDGQNAFVHVIGTHMLFYTLTGYILGKLNRIIDRDSMMPVMVVVLVTTVIVRICVKGLTWVIQDINQNYDIFGTAVYTAALAPVWFFVLSWVYRATAEAEQQ